MTFSVPRQEVPSRFCISSGEESTPVFTIATTRGSLVHAQYSPVDQSWSVDSDEKVFKKSIRSLIQVGSIFLVANASGKIVLVRDGKVHKKFEKFKDEAGEAVDISCIALISGQEDSDIIELAIGDDFGNVYITKLDLATLKIETTWVLQEQDDTITGLLYHSHKKTLVASSGDGTLLVLDLKKNKIVAHSESLDDEILTLALDLEGDIICGTGLGAIVRYKWGYWGKISHRLKPKFHEGSSVDCLTFSKPDELITGTVDGVIRMITYSQKSSGEPKIRVLDQKEDSIDGIAVAFEQIFYTLANDPSLYVIPLTYAPEVPESAVEPEPKRKKADSKKGKAKAEVSEGFFNGLL